MTNAEKLKQILKNIEKNDKELREFLSSIEHYPSYVKPNQPFSLSGLRKISERLLDTQEKLKQEYKP